MKKFISGIIVGSIITATVSTFASGVWDKIDVLKNDIKVVVNGKEVAADNFLYNDTTYLPLRAVSEALNQPVKFDEESNTAYIGSVPVDTLNLPKGTVPDPWYLEPDDGTYFVTNDEFKLSICNEWNEEIHNLEPIPYISVSNIDELIAELIGSTIYCATHKGIRPLYTTQYIIEYENVYSEGRIPLEFYYTDIVPWLRTLSK